ncbi:MAG: metal-dependent transcriptional regulator [Actinomycetota bacterium]|nr:metal-dependent transcriptional regulator [Actinomycetota bacterium]
MEDYAKALYALEARAGGPVGTSALAERLGLTPGSVSAMLRKLDELGVLVLTPYHGVQLTEEGRQLALEVIRHHRLIELFLSVQLGMGWDRVHQEAEVLEHWLSEDLEAAIAEKLNHPTVDPHGDPIPSADLQINEGSTVSVDSLTPGDEGVFVRVSDSDPEMLRFLADQGIAPGDRLRVIEKQPFDGPAVLSIAGKDAVIGGRLASAMRVELDRP